MSNWFNSLALVFVPLFISVDAIGTLPFVVSMSEGMSRPARFRMINLATATAGIVGVVFCSWAIWYYAQSVFPQALLLSPEE
ncbi:MAG: hypothetical protein PHQ43_04425 [Dehalococcoidales bacterium]|nr:hypothetical protein [Dehalococcoidales bacterium]